MKTKIIILSFSLLAILLSCKPKQPAVTEQVPAVIQPTDSMKMILARIYVKPGKEADFINAFKEMSENSNKEEGCLFYKLYQDPNEKSSFIVVERYKNQAAINYHFGTEYFKAFGPKTSDLTDKPTEIMIYNVSESKN
jgi:quinol monooxygenase YgiN